MHADQLLNPESVAVIGVSEDPRKLGSIVLRNLVAGGYAGRIYAVGRGSEIQNVRCCADATLLPEAVDVAFVAAPAAATLTIAEQCAARGVRSLIVGAAGFAEDGDALGRDRQNALAGVARATGMRLLGPNCNGIYNPHRSLSLGFNTAHGEVLRSGGVALLSHSGALFEAMVRRVETLGAGLSAFVSLGNEADLDVLDLLEDQIDNTATRVLALLIDALPDGERFARLAVRARLAKKAVVVLKLGRSELGADAAAAHSSRLVGNSEAYDALFRRCGVASCRTLEGFVDAAALLDRFGASAGGLGAITMSGAGGALIADAAERYGVETPPYGDATQACLAEFRRFSRIGNPTDVGVFAGAVRYPALFSAIAEDAGIGAVALLTHHMGALRSDVIPAMGESRKSSGKAHVLLAPGGLPPEDRAAARDAGIIILTETDAAIQALGALLAPGPPVTGDTEVVAGSLQLPPLQMRESESLDLLREFGLPTTPLAICHSAEECVTAAEAFGWPVVLKGELEGVAHKTEHGLVHVGLRAPADLVAAHAGMGAPARAIVQPMVRGDLEIIVGVTHSTGSGMTLLAGLGGIFAEALDLTVKWSVPAPADELARGLDRSALGRILASPRWRIAGARENLIDLLLKLQAFALAADARLEAVDLNPVIATREGLVAVDALIRARPPTDA